MTRVTKVEIHKHFFPWGNLNCITLAFLPVIFRPSLILQWYLEYILSEAWRQP